MGLGKWLPTPLTIVAIAAEIKDTVLLCSSSPLILSAIKSVMTSSGDGSDLASDVQHAVVRLKELGKAPLACVSH